LRFKLPYARAGVLLVCLALATCSNRPKGAGDANGNHTTAQTAPASPSPIPSPTPQVEPLRIPERVASGAVTESRGTWSKAVQSSTYLSAADNTRQPMMFYKPQRDEPRPLLVGLHSWSNNYRQKESVIYSEWCIANDWIFIHPNFRGPNNKPQVMGSELVIGDVLSAIDYAKANARVDETRIYAVGWSGGGFLGLLLAGRSPEIWAGVSAWVPPTLRSETTDPSAAGLKVLFQRQSGNARITVFDGAHDKNTEAAFRWLNQQRKSR
jgi:dienelactone hydrolase